MKRSMSLYLSSSVLFIVSALANHHRCYEEYGVCLTTPTEEMNQTSARDWCKNNNASLVAIITNETVRNAIAAYIRDNSSHWTKSEEDLFTDGKRKETPIWEWINGQNQTSVSQTDPDSFYAYLSRANAGNFTLVSDIANNARNFICSYTAINSVCRSTNDSPFSDRCYRVHQEKLTWFQARSRCLQNGSDLAIFETNISLSSISEKLPIGEFWIGLRREKYLFSDDQEMKYYNWLHGSPFFGNGDCICVNDPNSSIHMTNCECSSPHPFICIQGYVKIPPTPTSTTHFQPTTSADRNSSILLLAIGLGIVLLLVVAVVCLVVHFNKSKRKLTDAGRQRSGQTEPSQTEPAIYTQLGSAIDPVYAKLAPTERRIAS